MGEYIQAWTPVWHWAVGHKNNSTKTEIFFSHRRLGHNASFLSPDGVPFNTSMWGVNQPNEIWDKDTCVICEAEYCNDKNCDRPMPSLCQFDYHRPPLELRGLCNQSRLDHYYYPVSLNGTFTWIGAMGYTFIYYNHSAFHWVGRIYEAPLVIATAEVSHHSVLLGRSTWKIQNDRGCSSGEDFRVNVSLNACLRNQFNCDNGHCVELEARCDGRVSCQDGSDETGCHVVLLTPSYNRNVAPPNTTVNVSVHVDDVLDIEVTGGRVRLLVQLVLSWVDPRLMYVNLKDKAALNSLSHEEYEAIWRPRLIYLNMEPTPSRLVVDPVIVVHRQGPRGWSSIERVNRAETFRGSENSLQWSETMR
jgi:hypothetical protein